MFLNDMDFGFDDKAVTLSQINRHALGPLAAAVIPSAISAGGAILGGLFGDDDEYDPEVLPKTVSGQSKSDFDILYDKEAEAAMASLTEQINTWATADREFFKNTFQPFQESIIQTNQALLPAIEKTAGSSLEEVSRNLFSNRALKDTLSKAVELVGGDIIDVASNFKAELDNLPTSDERIGQALTAVEGQFGEIGKQLKRDLASRGVGVSQASERELAIEKAKAKAGAAGLAAESARTERRQAMTQGLTVLGTAQTAQTQQLIGFQGEDRAAAGSVGAQVGGVQATTGTALTQAQTGLTTTQATKQLGTETQQASIEHTQQGVQSAPKLDAEGQIVKDDLQTTTPGLRSTGQDNIKQWDVVDRFSGGSGGRGRL